MSAGVSNSKGTEVTDTNSVGQRKGNSWTQGQQDTAFNNTSTSQTNVPAWARTLNKNIAQGRASDEGDARGFLNSLLHDPYDAGNEGQNRFGAAIGRLFDYNLAKARGGTSQNGVARQGFREGAALAGAQDAAIGQGVTAANSLLTNANPLAALEWERLVAPQVRNDSGTATTDTMQHTLSREDTKGQETANTRMSGQNSGYGITLCCFIWLAHYQGKPIPWYVRRSRDEFASGPRVEGYRKMAKYLVPAMDESMLVRSMVKWLMIKPLESFGKWIYGEGGHGYMCTPLVIFWFTIWSLTGKTFNLEPNE